MIKRRFISIALATLLVLSSSFAIAEETLTTKQIIKAWGMDASLSSLSVQLQEASDTPQFSGNKPLKKAWKTAAGEVLSYARLESEMIIELDQLFTLQQRQGLAKFLTSPLGLKVTLLERQATDPAVRAMIDEKGAETWTLQSDVRKATIS